jgi:hypothetical protein
MSKSQNGPWVLILLVALGVAAGVYAVVTLDVSGPSVLPTSDQDDFEPTDAKLILYRELDPIKTEFLQVRGVAVGPGDQIYVSGDSEVRVYENSGRLLRKTPTSAATHAIAVDKTGDIYVAEADHFVVLDVDGKAKITSDKADKGADFTSIVVTDDAVYVGDAGNRVILKYGKDGKLVKRIRKLDAAGQIDGVLMPSAHFDVAVGSDGLIRANDPGRLKVDVYTAEGELLMSWGVASLKTHGFCGCCNPTELALLPDGGVVTAEKGLPRVKVYSSEGAFIGVVAGHESFPDGRCPLPDCSKGMSLDLAVDGAGRVLVLDPASGDVRIYVKKEAE